MKTAVVTIRLQIADERKIYNTAMRIYEEVNEDRDAAIVQPEFEDMYGTVDAPDLKECIRLIFDRGDELEGISIADSHAEIEDDGEDAGHPDGYSVDTSIWDSTSGRRGTSWIVHDPEGNRFQDDYGTEADGWKAARHHAKTGEQLPA